MSQTSARPVVVDLFAGAGGLSLGFEQAGYDVVAAVEYDPIHAAVHKYNFPTCQILCRDIHKVEGAQILAAAAKGVRSHSHHGWDGKIDVLVGGPSCQGFSSGGVRDDDDDRNGLLNEFVRLVCEIRPRAFVLENVPGLLEPRFDTFRRTAFKRLRNVGYSLSGEDRWYNAMDFGVPQSRRRVIVIGTLDMPHDSLVEPEIDVVSVASAFSGLPVIENYDALLTQSEVRLDGHDQRRRLETDGSYARGLAGIDPAADLGRPRKWDKGLLTGSRRTVHTDATIALFENTAQGAVESKSRLYRLSLDGVSRTLRAGTGRERGAHTSPRPIHPLLPRVITVREAARLHGYPDWFRFNQASWHGHRQVGNSVPPPLAKVIGTHLRSALEARPRVPRVPLELGDPDWCRLTPTEAAELVGALAEQLPAQRARN